jgi:clan AA aspartic protease
MGMIHTEITLINAMDEGNAKEGYIKADEVRSATVTAVVDTGAMSLVITEELFQKLGLTIEGEKIAYTANGQQIHCKMTSGVKFRWKNRDAILHSLVVPGAEEVLLGALPLESLDLIIHPSTGELVGAHGDEAVYIIY